MELSKMRIAKGRQRSEDESVKIDYSKAPGDILLEILTAINSPGVSSQRKLTCYNIFVKFYYREGLRVETCLTRRQILVCLQAGLFSKLKELRAASLRALRYYCSDLEVIREFFALRLHYFVVRSLDICLNNEVERTNALRLIRRIMSILFQTPANPRCQSPPPSSQISPHSPLSPMTSPSVHSSPQSLPLVMEPPRDGRLKPCLSHQTGIPGAALYHPSPPPLPPPHLPTLPLPVQSPCSPSPLMLPGLQATFTSLLQAVVSVANDGFVLKDKLFNICLSTVCELVIQDPFLASRIGGISCILRNVPQFHGHPRINEALVATVLNVFNFPCTRSLIRVNLDLEQMLVPFTDLEYKVSLELKDRFDVGSDVKYGACKLALGTILRSWSGIFYLCGGNSSGGVKSLLSMLGLSNMETRKEILDVFYDVFRFSIPEWTDDFDVALKSIAALSKTMDSWKLVNGFIAEEAKSILPHLSFHRLNLIDNHMSFVLRCFVDLGILEAVTKAVVSSDRHVCVRATVLLGELLHLTSILLPESCNTYRHCLPQLISTVMSSTVSNPSLRMQCTDALNCLLKIETSKRALPIESSNHFLRHQVILCFNAARICSFSSEGGPPSSLSDCSRWSVESAYNARTKKDSSAEREGGEMLPQLLKDSQVLYTTDSKSWDWFNVLTILKFPEESLEIADEVMAQRFLERLTQVFRPSGRIYSAMKISEEKNQEMTMIAFHLVDYLLNSPEQMATSLLFSFLQDVNTHLVKVIERPNVSESAMNPSSLINSCSQMYFLFIGRLSSTKKGNQLLRSSKIYDSFSLIASSSKSSDIIVKLMVSSLDYSNSGEARKILKEALASSSEKASQYCTSFFRILLRCRLPMFTRWAVPLLIGQLRNQSMAVATEALSVLLEAAEDEEHLRMIAGQRHDLRHLGFKSDSLSARLLAVPDLFVQLSKDGTLEREMEKWKKHNNTEFVEVVEERLVESMTTYERTYDYSYARRTSRKYVRKDVLVPIHLYGQLVQHEEGIQHLRRQEYLDDYFEVIRRSAGCTRESLKSTKAALWIMGHIGSTEGGLGILVEKNVLNDIIRVAERSPILTLRGTAFYVLSMLSMTRSGRSELENRGWICVRKDKVDPFFVMQVMPTNPPPTRDGDSRSHPVVDFALEVPDKTGDPTGPRSIPHSSSVEGFQTTVASRRQSILSTFMKKFKSKSQKAALGRAEPSQRETLGTEREEVRRGDEPRKKTESQTSSVSSEVVERPSLDAHFFSGEVRRSSEGQTEVKVAFGSVQSSCSSAGKMSTSACSEENHFSGSSVFLAPEDRPKGGWTKGAGEAGASHSLEVEREGPPAGEFSSSSSSTARACSADSEEKIAQGFLSDPNILRPKVSSRHRQQVWLTVEDVMERHKKTKSLDYRSIQKNSSFRHSLKDKIKNFRHPRGNRRKRSLRDSLFPLDDLALRRAPSHFVCISLPLKMEQVFQSIKSRPEDHPDVPWRNPSLSLRKEFFGHPMSHERLSNRESFGHLFDGFEEHRVVACFLCSNRKKGDIQDPPLAFPSASIPTISEESPEGQKMIRKELLRLVLQLSCTVGNKSTEQGLLIMKQRFPDSFRSLCLYSDVSDLLGTCSFRLESRRFIQELFIELDFEECHSEARQILNIPDLPSSSSSTSGSVGRRRKSSPSSSSSMPTDEFKTAFSDFDFTHDPSIS